MNVDLNKYIEYRHASFKKAKKGERHLKRFCPEDVLLVVISGVLRFSENGIIREVPAGHYYIQHHDMMQDGPVDSDEPFYLYVHCLLDYTDGEGLPTSGTFDAESLMPQLKKMDETAHSTAPIIEKTAAFYQILTALYGTRKGGGRAEKIKDYLAEHCGRKLTLEELGEHFGYSKNQIISIVKSEFSVTPMALLGKIRIDRAKDLIETTDESLDAISYLSGFGDYSAFYKQFTKTTGVSPNEWRRMSREGKIDEWRK